MGIAARLDDIGKPAWISATILGFILCWPVGLAILFYLFWSGRMASWRHGGWHRGCWDEMRKARGQWQGRGCGWGRNWNRQESSGNTAFDEYRADTLRRLEEEQKEFFEFLERLRQAKDKAEFDQFMSERRDRPQGPGHGSGQGPDNPDAQPSA